MVKNPPAMRISGSGRSPGQGNVYPLQYCCLENSKDRGAWRATVHGVVNESDMTEGLNNKRVLNKGVNSSDLCFKFFFLIMLLFLCSKL